MSKILDLKNPLNFKDSDFTIGSTNIVIGEVGSGISTLLNRLF